MPTDKQKSNKGKQKNLVPLNKRTNDITGCVYMVTNRINGKIYIGKTIRDLKERKQQHLRDSVYPKHYFHRAIKKYGENNFTWEKLFESKDDKELLKKEKEYIGKYESNRKGVGYNLTLGGEGISGGILGSTLYRKLIHEYVEIECLYKWAFNNSVLVINGTLTNEVFTSKIKIDWCNMIILSYKTAKKMKEKMEAILDMYIEDNNRYYVKGYYDSVIEAAS